MFLKKMLYVNWGNIPQLELDFGPVNLFSGGNGSGKTTAADGIQTLMTAAYENLFNFNPGQDETTQRGRGGKQVRTLASYVLGCDDGSYARLSTTDGYLGAVFAPGRGEKAEPFTILMGMRAHLDSAGNQRQARLDDVQFFILPAIELSLDKLVRSYSDGKHVVPIHELTDLLQREFGKKALEVYDKKGAYLRRLYGLLRGKRDAVSDREAKHAARTFANFMAYKPVKSINDFVAEEILEKKDLGEAIRTVSDLMKTIHGMEEDARHIRESLGILQQASATSSHYVEHWILRAVLRYQEASRQFQLKQKAYIDTKQLQKKLQDDIQERETRLAVNRERRAETHQQIVELEAQRRGISVLNEKDQLQATITKLQHALTGKAAPLLQQDQQLRRNLDSTKQIAASLQQQSWGTDIAALDQKPLRESLRAVLKLEQTHGIDLQRLFNRDWVDIAPLEEYLDRAIELDTLHNQWSDRLHLPVSEQTASVRDQLAALKNEWERELQSQQRQLQQKEKEIAQLEARKVSYPPGVEVALKAIRAQCPDADPRVLCDYIDVLDPQWQMAIEGYLGGARFSIIVQPEYEAEAIRIVRNLPGQRNSARVIQGSKAQRDAERFQPAADSIIHILKFQHKTAEYYLRASYGSVVRVPDAETLRSTARGITSNGLASGNYSMWRCDIPDAELVFGQSARERALVAKQKELETLLAGMTQRQQQVEAALQLFKAVTSVQGISFGRTLQEMLDIHRQLKRSEQALAQLDTGDFERLEAELVQTRQRFAELEADLKQLENDKGRTQEQLNAATRAAEALDKDKEKLQSEAERNEVAVRQIQHWQPQCDVDQLLLDADAQLTVDDHSFYRDELNNIDKILQQDANNLFNTIMQHNQRCNPFDAIVYDPDFSQLHEPAFFKRISDLVAEVDNIRNRLQNNVLVEKHEHLTQLRDRFNETFVSHLCHSIYQAINEGERALKDLNRELEHHRFGTDQERFYFAWDWVPEFREYWRFFKEVSQLPNQGDGVSLFDMELPKAVQSVREKLVAMLLDDDEQRAFRELQRIADYRHYRNYEIYKEPLGKAPIPLSQYGTGSGGQLETPAYIIRSAAITSAFRFNEGNTHLRMVLVDEAFSKMDETRSREVISYLTDTLGLQLVFIMPTSKSGPFMDIISNQTVFSKCQSTRKIGELNTRVLVDRKECNQERIKALWQQQRTSIREQATLDFMEGIE